MKIGPKINKSRSWNSGLKQKSIVAIDGWGNETLYPSGREAARQLGINQSGITYVLSGKRKSSGGYRFRYADTN